MNQRNVNSKVPVKPHLQEILYLMLLDNPFDPLRVDSGPFTIKIREEN